MNKKAHVFVTGKVQGVYFRLSTQNIAKSHRVTGWIRNRSDGRVEAVLEGEESEVKKLVDYCRKGPKGAAVTDISVEWNPSKDEFTTFTITEDY